MIAWTYTIQGQHSLIITKNPDYAEQKSRLGYRVFCKRDRHKYCYHHG